MKSSPSSAVLGRNKRAVSLFWFGFCLCFYALNPEYRTFLLHSLRALEQGERHRLQVPEGRPRWKAGQGDVAKRPALGYSFFYYLNSLFFKLLHKSPVPLIDLSPDASTPQHMPSPPCCLCPLIMLICKHTSPSVDLLPLPLPCLPS